MVTLLSCLLPIWRYCSCATWSISLLLMTFQFRVLFQVGALAARRAKEKAHDRQRRMSLDRAPHTLDQSSFTSMKESSMRAKRGASPDFQTVCDNFPPTSISSGWELTAGPLPHLLVLSEPEEWRWCLRQHAVRLCLVFHPEELSQRGRRPSWVS